MASESVAIPAEAIRDIRRMLLIGLHAYGECERIQTECDAAEKMGRKPDRLLTPILMTADYETANFAEALHWLEYVTPVEDRNGEA